MLLQDPVSSAQEDSVLESPRWIAQERTSQSHLTSASRFTEVAEPHIPLMLRAARGILGSEDLAWDAVQETLLRVWTKGWIHEAPAKALVHLAVKSSLHQLRCQRRRSDHEARREETYSPCCDEDPLLALESAELAQLVREAIEGLAVEYRTVIELYEFGGLSYDDIAGRLDLPIGTVRSRISRARALLHERLGAHFHAA